MWIDDELIFIAIMPKYSPIMQMVSDISHE